MRHKLKDGIHITARDAILNMCLASRGRGPNKDLYTVHIESITYCVSDIIILTSKKVAGLLVIAYYLLAVQSFFRLNVILMLHMYMHACMLSKRICQCTSDYITRTKK